MKLLHRRRLLTLMVVQDLTQRRLAEAAGYHSHAYLGRLLRGEVDTLDAEAAERIARRLGVDVADLFAPLTSTVPGRSAHHRPRVLA